MEARRRGFYGGQANADPVRHANNPIGTGVKPRIGEEDGGM
jgi:hypothetical protein